LGSLGGGDGQGGHDHDGGVPEGEVEAGVDRAFAVLHQFTHDVVDGGDVVGVHGVAQAEHPGPGGDIGGDQYRVEAGRAVPLTGLRGTCLRCLRVHRAALPVTRCRSRTEMPGVPHSGKAGRKGAR
jgi:hypothetical protein